MKILNTKNSQHQKLKCVIYGESGAGKTSLAGTLGAGTIVFSAEAGLLALKDKGIDYLDISIDDKGEPITDPALRLKRLSDAYQWAYNGFPDDKGKATFAYKHIMVDSLTEIGELMVEVLNKQFPDRKDSFPMWGEYSKRMRSIVKSFRDLPYNIFMTCVAEPDVDENKRRFMGFQVAGSISRKLPQYFDEVFYLYVDSEGKRSLITNKTDAFICKDRSNKLLPQEPADLSLIMSKIFNKEEK